MSESKFRIPSGAGQGRDGVDIIFDMPCQRRRAAPSAHFYVVSIHISVMALVYVRVHAPTNLSVFMPRNCQQLLSNAYGKREEFANKEETIINLVGVGDSQPSLSASRDKRFLVRAPLSLPLWPVIRSWRCRLRRARVTAECQISARNQVEVLSWRRKIFFL